MSAVDKSSMGRFMSSEGTDAATSNVIAGAVSDVWRAHFGNEWVPFSVRYGIAHEVQRRLAQRSVDPSSSGPASHLERGINAPSRDHTDGGRDV